jgi:hypothetical protein
MPRAGFEPTVPVFERLETVRALDSAAIGTGSSEIKIYKTAVLAVVLYGCETWFLTLSEEHRLMLFENRVLKRIFGPKKEEVAGGWRRLHNEELHNLYTSTYFIRLID